ILVGRRSVLGRSGAPTMAESSDGLGSVGKGPLWPTLQGRSDQVVSIERQADGDRIATWHDASVPVVMRYTHPDAAELADGGHENWDRHRSSVIGASPIFVRVDDRQSGIAADGAAGCQRNGQAGFDPVRALV
ncbi:MAG: hypothetical protein NTY19_44405, partial [Planctomycetota bacterium]|nr:hypothetical protein [Planctomycetota bacterium]